MSHANYRYLNVSHSLITHDNKYERNIALYSDNVREQTNWLE